MGENLSEGCQSNTTRNDRSEWRMKVSRVVLVVQFNLVQLSPSPGAARFVQGFMDAHSCLSHVGRFFSPSKKTRQSVQNTDHVDLDMPVVHCIRGQIQYTLLIKIQILTPTSSNSGRPKPYHQTTFHYYERVPL